MTVSDMLPYAAIGVPVVLGFFAYLRHIDRENRNAHDSIHKKIDGNHEKLTDRLMKIWQHMNEQD